jgi:hypothetical protein
MWIISFSCRFDGDNKRAVWAGNVKFCTEARRNCSNIFRLEYCFVIQNNRGGNCAKLLGHFLQI